MAGREYIYYQGCAQEGTAQEYDASLKLVMAKLGCSLKEAEDWSCCGSTPAHTVDEVLAAALAARNLAIVEKMGADTVTTPCPACLTALKTAHLHMGRSQKFREAANALLDHPYNCTVTAKSNLQVIYEDIGLEEIARPVTHKLPALKVAPYYGCILNRPPGVAQFDDPENPVAMDKIMSAIGVEVVDFAFKTECCGAAFGVAKRQMVNELIYKVMTMALDAGANCIIVACPLCQQNLDLRQSQVNRTMQSDFNVPILYFTQVMGLAYGMDPKALGFGKLVVSTDDIIKSRVSVEEFEKRQKEAQEKASESQKEIKES
ncbi:MAG: CoB--CoM heterodisulfide reductase iron-sulfur subunit B family protein [Dehalococcoidia bacterium]|nr:CoB--CoM heterodisulfide reductase iron-sulfur subunit B family protein [Dehalococcoidia bacterium]